LWSMPTLVVDNGAGVLKASFVPQKLDHQAKLLDATPVRPSTFEQ
jgi:hypothetical protein